MKQTIISAVYDFKKKQPQLIIAEQLGYIILHFENPVIERTGNGYANRFVCQRYRRVEFQRARRANRRGSRSSPDGKQVVYIVTKKGISNLWAQPLNGDQPGQLTNFTNNRIYSFDFSPDGKEIISARGELSGYVVLLTNK